MKLLLGLSCALLLALAARAAPARTFTENLSPAQKERLGLAALTPAQLAELDAAVAEYGRGTETVAVKAAVQEAEKKAAETAVEEYKKKKEPGVIARTLEMFKRKTEEEHIERFTAKVAGPFIGWRGGTYFPLQNGQVWRQISTDSYELAPAQDVEVEIFKSKNGYWRLKLPDGAWVTVKRLQ
jgi:hypothetical protein